MLIRANSRWQAIARLDRPEAYVRKMIVNEYLSWRRRLWRLVPSGAGADLGGQATPDPAAGYVEREAIAAELAKLPRRQRTVLVLRYYEGSPIWRSRKFWAAGPAPCAGGGIGESPEVRGRLVS